MTSRPPLLGADVVAGSGKPRPLPIARIANTGVTLAAHPGTPPRGTGVQVLKVGQGRTVTDPASIRIAYVAQTWQGSPIHDSWAKRTLQEPLTAEAGTKYLTEYFGHATVGTAIELLVAPGQFRPAVQQDVLLVAQLTAGT